MNKRKGITQRSFKADIIARINMIDCGNPLFLTRDEVRNLADRITDMVKLCAYTAQHNAYARHYKPASK